MEHLLERFEAGITSFFEPEKHSHSHVGYECDSAHPDTHSANRFQSFVSPSSGDAKWYVDGCSYFWAVSEALEEARESIFILDWWLSPELYLRRPPSRNERYRLDAMLKAAADRGVKVYVIVYKEVEAALSLDSAHTKHALEALNPDNIKVFRHPDHLPTGYDITSELGRFDKLTNFDICTVSKDAVKAIYGAVDDVVLYWAHHEKLVVIDRKLVFMGGLDLCFGRWDTNSHPIADAHPGNLDNIVFPGQDYNNARIFDFADVGNWNQNKLDRTKSSRMGWSDVALSLNGPIVDDLVSHFTDRWNFIFDAKYGAKDPGKYEKLLDNHGRGRSQGRDHIYDRFTRGITDQMENLGLQSHRHHRQPDHDRSLDDDDDGAARIQLTRSCTKWSAGHPTEHSIANAYVYAITTARHYIYIENQFFITATSNRQRPVANKIGAAIVDRIIRARDEDEMFKVWVVMPAVPAFAGQLNSKEALGTRAIMDYQYKSICRGGNSIIEKLQEAGIADASQYIGFYNLRNYDRINTSQTMRDAEQRSGVRYEDARRAHDDYANADGYPRYGDDGDRRRYNDGGRYDDSGRYDDRNRYDDRSRYDDGGRYGNDRHRYGDDGYGYHDQTRYDDRAGYEQRNRYESYQREASRVTDSTLDTVSSCYMANGNDIANVPWDGHPDDEMDAFVSEQLYIHSKLLIADDRLVICGSANLNDRSQLGTHDSEIAVVIEGGPTVDSYMAGHPFRASEFALTLRRQIFRKHLGLLPDQPWDRPDQNWCSVARAPNTYDYGSRGDRIVEDPLAPRFLNLWEDTATVNTETFGRAFHPVPDDRVRNWKEYDDFFTRYFIFPGDKKEDEEKARRSGKVPYGHVVRGEFPGGVEEVKEWLARIRGNIVHMPLEFLADVENLAEEGLTLNGLTNELYT